jgi:hypothetical protein
MKALAERTLIRAVAAALAGFKNREAAWTLALFLARYWSMPGKVSGSLRRSPPSVAR